MESVSANKSQLYQSQDTANVPKIKIPTGQASKNLVNLCSRDGVSRKMKPHLTPSQSPGQITGHNSSLFQQLQDPISTQRESYPKNMSIEASQPQKYKQSSATDALYSDGMSSHFNESQGSEKKITFASYSTQDKFQFKHHYFIDGTSGSVHGYKHKLDKREIGETLCRSLVGKLPKKPQVQIYTITQQSVDNSGIFSGSKFKDSVFTQKDNINRQLSNRISYEFAGKTCQDQSQDGDAVNIYGVGDLSQPQTVRARVETLFKPKELQQLRETIRNKISGVFDLQLARATSIEWKNHSASTKCALQAQDELPTTDRKKLMKFLTEKKPQVSCRRYESAPQQPIEPKNLPQIEKYDKVPNKRMDASQRQKKKQLLQNLDYIQNLAMFDNPEAMRQTLHHTTRYAHQKHNQNPLCHSFTSSDHMKKFVMKKFTQSFSKTFNKYADFGELGKKYSILEKQKVLDLIQSDQRNQAAAVTKVFPDVTGEVIAGMITRSPVQKGMTMIYRQKPWVSQQEQEVLQFESKVLSYCQQLTDEPLIYEEKYDLDNTQSKSELTSPRAQKIQIYTRMSVDVDEQNQFEAFVSQCSTKNPIQNIANSLLDKLNFQQVCKLNELYPQKAVEFGKDPNTLYFAQCKRKLQPAVDLLNKIKSKSLVLENYNLQLGQCIGFTEACKIDDDLIQNLFISECSMTDEVLAELITGLCSLKKVKMLNLIREEIGHKSLDALRKLFQKQIPFNLNDLRIENCKISPQIVESILLSLQPNAHLCSLTLIGVQFNDRGLRLLTEYIKSSRHLSGIDLSFCRITANHMMPILRAICESRRLSNINLSWNSLCENPNYAQVGSYCLNYEELATRKSFRKRKKANIIQKASEVRMQKLLGIEAKPKPKSFNEKEKEVVDLLQKMLTKNGKLIHLDLSETMLSEDMLVELAKALKYSQSLLAVHLSGNPGLTQIIMQKILGRLNASYDKPVKIQSFNQFLNRTQEPKQNKLLQSPAEALKIKEIAQEKRMLIPCDAGKLSDPQRRHFILSRKIGHHLDIPGSFHWQLHCNKYEDCYVCDRKIYTFFFWSPELGRIESSDLNLSQKEQTLIINEVVNKTKHAEMRVEQLKLVKELSSQSQKQRFDSKTGTYVDDGPDLSDEEEIANNRPSMNLLSQSSIDDQSVQRGSMVNIMDTNATPEPYNEFINEPSIFETTEPLKQVKASRYEIPYIYGQFNNWMPQPLVKISRLAKVLEQDLGTQPDFLNELRTRGEIRDSVINIKDMTKRERQRFEAHLREYEKRFNQKKIWEKILLKFIVYRQPNLVGASKLNQIDTTKIFVGATFMDVGRQPYVVKYCNKFYFHQTVCNFRREDIVFPKLDAKDFNKIERNPVVFKNWVVDSENIIDQCLKCDFEGWKLKNFVKDPGDQSDIKLIIKENYVFLKDVFASLSIKSNWPNMTSLDFSVFIDTVKIPDKTTTFGIIDTQFIACRVDQEKRNLKVFGQNQNDINRFEFLEAVVRVANCKFKQQQPGMSWGEALKLMIRQIKQYFVPNELQPFRDNQLWARDCNLVFDANKVGIMALYQAYTHPKIKKMTNELAMKLMTQDSSVKLAEKDAIICYGSCQMTCVDIVKNSKDELFTLDFLEFLELIGRVAHQYFLGSESDQKPLCDKIAYILDEWLAVIGLQREEAQPYEEGGFEDSEEDQDSIGVDSIGSMVLLPGLYD